MEAGEFLSPATRAYTRCTKTMPKEREVDLVHHEPCHRSMDQRILVYREPHSRPRVVDHGPVEAHGYDVAAP